MNPPSQDRAGDSGCTRRNFLVLGGLAAAGGLISVSSRSFAADTETGGMMPVTGSVFECAALPYAYDALAPSIDEETMHLHHDKHYAAYTKNLNAALEQTPELQGKAIEDLLADTKSLPAGVRKAIRNNGGGYYNHSLFWRMMKPGGSKPAGGIAAAIEKKFGGLEAFRETFSKEAGSVFGSGWTWLIVDPSGELAITTTPNQDSPIMDVAEASGKPVLGLDVWEHAYYLKYKNVRADYIKSWWDVVNWDTAGELYDAAKA